MQKITWKTKTMPVAQLKLWDDNPRSITEEDYNKLKARIVERGFHDVIKIDTDNTILSGNMRRRALEELGITEVTVIYPSRALTSDERIKVALESNHNDGRWSMDQLANLDLDQLKVIFDDKQIENLTELKPPDMPNLDGNEVQSKLLTIYLPPEDMAECMETLKLQEGKTVSEQFLALVRDYNGT